MITKYKKIKKLGDGKHGTVYLVSHKDTGREYAMKCFRKNKNISQFMKEVNLHKKAAKADISPKIRYVSKHKKCFVMDYLKNDLYTYLTKNKGDISWNMQEKIYKIYKKLDKIGVFHGDSNILNYMLKGSKLYLIDYGFAQPIDEKLCKKLGTRTPNADIMLLGLVMKLKELGCPSTSYSYLQTKLTSKQRKLL